MSGCIRAFFKEVDPEEPPPTRTGFGFRWQAGEAVTDFDELKDNDPGGLYIGFMDDIAGSLVNFFSDPNYGLGIIFEPVTISPDYEQRMTELTGIADEDTLKTLEGYLKYTNDCLSYIYATAAGKTLLDALAASGKITLIFPSAAGNQYSGGGNILMPTAGTIINNQFNIEGNRTALMQALRDAAGEQPNDTARFNWLATQVNQIPLYSLFVPSAEYEDQFLTTSEHTVTGANLQQWFENGDDCQFVQEFNVLDKVDEVNILKFVRIAVIVTLYPHSANNTGGTTTVQFDVKDYKDNTLDVPDINAERPPAIGLAHELVHAYHVSRGEQPGRDFGDYSTTLTELICVGLGPWSENAVSENAVRAHWPPENVPETDHLNRPAYEIEPRDPYESPPGSETAADMRAHYGAI